MMTILRSKLNRNIKQGFIDFITNRFHNYTPYITSKETSTKQNIKSDVIQVLKVYSSKISHLLHAKILSVGSFYLI
jgi:HKD family nuclease